MNTFKRIKSTLFASFDHVVTMLENHEALVETAIKEARHSAANASIQLKRVKQDSSKMQNQIQECKKTIELWQARIISTGGLDRGKALECLKRKKLLEQQIVDLEKNYSENIKLEVQLVKDLKLIESKITDLRLKKQAFKSREASAVALQAINSSQTGLIAEIDDIFDRWDIKITESESLSKINNIGIDELELEFASAEDQQALDEELNQILK